MDYKITNKTIDKLKYDLVREGLLDYNQLIDAIEQSRDQQTNLGQILIQNNTISEEDLLNFLERKLHIPYVNLDDYTLDMNSINLIRDQDAIKYRIIPLFVIEDTLTVAMADPLDLFALNNINLKSNYKVEPVICSERSILTTINKFYKSEIKTNTTDTTTIEAEKVETVSKFDWQSELSEEKIDKANTYRLVRAIIYQAVNEEASEIHLDPQKDDLSVRFRIDGIMYNRGSLPILLASNCISRIKSASGMNVNEQFIPQYGRMEINVEKSIVNTRVSTYPTSFGEKIVIKVFIKQYSFKELGLENDQLKLFTNALEKNSGIIISTGPLGNGQTSTFYSALDHLNNESKNIMTIENPVRYNIDNINQSQVNTAKGFNIEDALKAIQLQEPDIIYVDEITTLNHIEHLIRLALGGKVILTTITADSAIGIVYNLIHNGINPNLILSTLNLTFSQRLIRLLCPKCKTETKLDSQIIEKFSLPENITYYKPKGCSFCNNFGYKGRTAIFELFSPSEYNIQHLNQNVSEQEFLSFLKNSDHKTLKDAALIKLIHGLTSYTEVKKILKL